MTKTEAHEVLEKIEERFKTPGCCHVLSKGRECDCILCLCDKLREFVVDAQE